MFKWTAQGELLPACKEHFAEKKRDCQGVWSECSRGGSCSSKTSAPAGTQTFTITRMPSANGKPCPQSLTRPCVPSTPCMWGDGMMGGSCKAEKVGGLLKDYGIYDYDPMSHDHTTWELRKVKQSNDELVLQVVCNSERDCSSAAKPSYMSQTMYQAVSSQAKNPLTSKFEAPINVYFRINPEYLPRLLAYLGRSCSDESYGMRPGNFSVFVYNDVADYESRALETQGKVGKVSQVELVQFERDCVRYQNAVIKLTSPPQIKLNSVISIKFRQDGKKQSSAPDFSISDLLLIDGKYVVWAISNISDWDHNWCPFGATLMVGSGA